MKRQLAWLLPLALVVALGFWIARQPEAPGSASAGAPPAAMPRYALTGVNWLRLDSKGQPQFRAQAAQIDFYDDDSARLQTLSLDALGGLDSPWRFNSPSGFVPPGQKRLRLDGPVAGTGKLANGDTVHLNAAQLWVDSAKREISSETAVQIDAPRRQAQAQGLRADFGGKRVELRGKVQATYAPK